MCPLATPSLSTHNHTLHCITVRRRDSIDATHYPVFHQMEGLRVYSPADWGSQDPTEFAEQQLKKGLEGLAQHLFGAYTSVVAWFKKPDCVRAMAMLLIHSQNLFNPLARTLHPARRQGGDAVDRRLLSLHGALLRAGDPVQGAVAGGAGLRRHPAVHHRQGRLRGAQGLGIRVRCGERGELVRRVHT